MQYRQETKTSAEQSLSPQTLQLFSLLQMDTADLCELVNHCFESNPLLELCGSAPERQDAPFRPLSPRGEERRANQTDESEPPEPPVVSPFLYGYSLLDSVRYQLEMLRVSGETRDITLYIASGLNKRGFLTETPAEIAGCLAVGETQVRECLSLLKTLEPPGLACASAEEYLLMQLHGQPGAENARQIIQKELRSLLRGDYEHIASRLHLSAEEVLQAAGLIRSLDGSPVDWDSQSAAAEYVVPDIILRRDGGALSPSLNDGPIPQLQISRDYLHLAAESGDEELESYLNEKLRQAQQLLQNIEKRQQTILNCTQALIALQEEYFSGCRAAPRPLRCADIAARLDISDSTVYRAFHGKYLQWEKGVFPLTYFFPRQLRPAEPAVSAERVKEELKRMLYAENPARPLTDADCCCRLAEQGLTVSRRIVAKYRESLGIENSFRRKT